MTTYERLLQFAYENGIHVGSSHDPRCLGRATNRNSITIDMGRVHTEAKAAEILAHELGHIVTDSYDAEHKAWEWAVKALTPRGEVYNALENNDGNLWETAKELGVSYDFLRRALKYHEGVT